MKRRITDKIRREYNNNRVGSSPHSILVEAMGMLQEKNNALDLGCGAMVETKYMIESGLHHVTAVDKVQDHECPQRVTFVCAKIEEFEFPVNAYDLVSAMFVLPFVKKSELATVVRGIHQSIRKGGIFVGTFFGPEDYRLETFQGFCTLEKEKIIEQIIAGLELVCIREEKAQTRFGLAHIFSFIARKA